MTPPPTPQAGAPVFPGIALFLAEPPLPGRGPLWQINGCVENGNPDDIESWGWLATVAGYWGHEPGDLARFLARAGNCHNVLVAALDALFNAYDWSDGGPCGAAPDDCPACAAVEQATAALALAREEPS